MTKRYTVQQAAKITGVSAHTLRYYERIGLLDIARASNGHRRYTENDLDWVRFILVLRGTGMALSDIAEFIRLEKGGLGTIHQRQTLLEQHREALMEHLAELHAHLGALDAKIECYREENLQPSGRVKIDRTKPVPSSN